MNAKAIFKTAKTTVEEFFKDNCLNVAAATAYYTLQAIIPLILGFIVVGSFFLKEGESRQNFINSIKAALPNSGFDIGTIIDELTKSAPGLLSVSALFLLWSGSGIFDQLVFGINVAYDVEKDSRSFIVKTALRLGLLVAAGGLIAAAFTVTILFQILVSADVSVFGISPKNFSFILPVLSILVPVLLMFAVFAMLYKFGPDRKGNKWQYVAVGAAVAAVLFEALKYGFTFYVTSFGAADSYQKTYGALGGILLFLLYIWLSAAIMLFGAELASVLGGWKSVLEGPSAQEDPGVRNEAEKMDSPGGPLVTKGEKATGKARPKMADKADEGKDVPADTYRPKKPLPSYAVSTQRFPAQPDRNNPVTIVIGTVVLLLAGLIALVFKRKDPAA